MTEPHNTEMVEREDPRRRQEDSLSADWDEWWSTDRADALGWVAIFLWAALVVVAEYTTIRDNFDWWHGWGVFLLGAGLIVLIETGVRLVIPEYKSKWGWTLFWGSAFVAVGLSELAHPALVGIAARRDRDIDPGWCLGPQSLTPQ